MKIEILGDRPASRKVGNPAHLPPHFLQGVERDDYAIKRPTR
jgi:hypothetical protein